MGSGPILLVQWTLLLFSFQEACAMMRSGQEGMFTTRPPKLWTLSARLALSSLEILKWIEIWLTVEVCRICWGTPIVKAKARSSKQVVQWYRNGRKPVATLRPLRPHESANHPKHEICKANWLKLWKRAVFALHGCDGIVVIQIHLQQCWSHFWQGEQCKDKSTKCNFSFPHCHLSFHVFCRFDQASSKKHYTASHNVCSLWWSVRPEVSSSCRADTIHFCEPCRWFWIRRWGGASRHLSPQKVRCPVHTHHSLRAFQVRNPQLRYTSRTDPWKRPHRATRPPSKESCGLRLGRLQSKAGCWASCECCFNVYRIYIADRAGFLSLMKTL